LADDYEILRLGDVTLQSGEILADAQLAYATVGRLNSARDNVIVMPTYYTGSHRNYLALIGPGKALDSSRYFIVIPNMFGNGLSSSPSTTRLDASQRSFPRVTIYDNVVQQARLVFDVLDAASLAMVCGWSMGGIQAYQWAVLYPDKVQRLLPYGAAARISAYNHVFLESAKSALQADARWRNGPSSEQPLDGIRAFARVYAGWAYSQDFFRDELYKKLGYASIEALLRGWEEDHLKFDAADLLAMVDTWQHADVSANQRFLGNLPDALRCIRADTILLPCSTDRYFPEQDNKFEAELIPHCEVRTLNSAFGHCALSPGRVGSATAFLEACLAALLSR
jgi:homoserine O-acetyltransferase